jgi:hypothetical protein
VNDGSGSSQPNSPASENAGLVEFSVGDHLQLGEYMTLLGGERFSIYRAELNESATYPRIGATVRIPKLNWVLRGFYGHFFQPAPIITVSSSVLNYASSLGGGENTFTPLPSERDEESQFGIEIPYRGWMLDVDTFKNRVNNFLDHSCIGESNACIPIAVDGALIRAWEMTLHSPSLGRYGQFYVTYSNQIAEQRGNIVGGLTCSIATDPACDLGPDYIALDHDQRDTLNTVQRAVSARPHDVRCVGRTFLQRKLEAVRDCDQCDQSPRAAGQLDHHRRISLERSANVRGGGAVQVSLLSFQLSAVSYQLVAHGESVGSPTGRPGSVAPTGLDRLLCCFPRVPSAVADSTLG